MIVSDSFGRAWRQGTTDVALGVAGIAPSATSAGRGRTGPGAEDDADRSRGRARGRRRARDGEVAGVPAAVVRGVDARGDGSAAELVMPRERDLFR